MNLFTGKEYALQGMTAAVEHADKVHVDWSKSAYKLLCLYLVTIGIDNGFMAEDFREWIKENNLLPEPPHTRAFGAIMQKAAKNNLITRAGFGQVRNPKAHAANATVWKKC